ncbi:MULTISPECIES: EboA domain-containing protein [unclassified Robiginitalea]|uniref:EboA domain-containing protein n=1 Tax=Robiginitalea TaxID=252306 RepID=UPI0023492E01|nr:MULTISPECIES: EboA domain-containing protein [unclassified Robiginitalea]MDC6353713.1 EboA domain-containing protein [Robiginitalea sp. PM2]
MDTNNVSRRLRILLTDTLKPGQLEWLDERIDRITGEPSGKDLFLSYSLIGRKIPGSGVELNQAAPSAVTDYIWEHGIRCDQLARIYLLASVLEADPEYFTPKVATLIQVADTGELVTFLRYLPVLPAAGAFKESAVEALRTNIATVFDAIALGNPYPVEHFNQQQWNQMYLKAAFMGRDLLQIQGVGKRANAELARIISDYAHERWAASRAVDPQIWRPVGPFLEGPLIGDMQRLLDSPDIREQQAGYLCCRASDSEAAGKLIDGHPVEKKYEANPFDWRDIKA